MMRAEHGLSCAADAAVRRSFHSSSLSRALDFAAALLLPAYCRLCFHRPLLRARAFPLCDACTAGLRDGRLELCCSICSEPLGYESAPGDDAHLCETCTEARPEFVRATAFGSYDALRSVLRLFKFEGAQTLARPLGALLAEAILLQADGIPESITVVPVPLYRRKRLYNQSLLLAQAAIPIVRRARPEIKMELAPRSMKRIHQKESQYRLSPKERRANVRGDFEVRGDLRGRHVLLIDDVYTTGATSLECTEVLLAAGAASVRVATLARAGKNLPARWSPSLDSMASAERIAHGYSGNPLYPAPLGP